MGKWTYNYTEQILNAKISSLVTGAINRAAVEKGPTITFDAFVHALDTGDSFTASLIDILVTELADRASRTENDRRLISDRTADSLRLLTTPLRRYPSARNFIGRRPANLAGYLSMPPNEMELEDDEDEFSTAYDAVMGTAWPVTARRVVSSSPSPPLPESASSTTRIPASSSRSGPWSIGSIQPSSETNTSLVRQPSIRRPPRSRTVDFNEFTHRRRSTIRDLQANPAESVTEPRETTWIRASQPTRRFFPFTRTRRHESLNNVGWDIPSMNTTENTSPLSSDGEVSETTEHRTMSLPSSSTTNQTNEEWGGPRLRRGGLRPPESLLSRHVSPVVFLPPDRHAASSSNSGPTSTDGPASYPTPESTENDNLTA